MEGLLLLGGLIALIYWATKRESPRISSDSQFSQEDQLQQRNYEWAMFIASYAASAKNKAEKDLIAKMLADIQAKGLPVPMSEDVVQPQTPINLADQSGDSGDDGDTTEFEPSPLVQQSTAANFTKTQENIQSQIQLDNASLLLYFGAFLFVASAGLFVSFGSLAGSLKTAIVLLVCITMYAGGMWIYENKFKLRQAAMAFTGIGLAIAPLVGLAAYTYIFDQSQGALTWFTTSVFCLGLYLHALVKLRSTLLSYVFIFTLLSLFESAIAIVDVPIYYYGWGLAFVGLALSLYARLNKNVLDLQEAANNSAALFLPLALIISLVMVGTEGIVQLGVSALLAGSYYLLEATKPSDTNMDSNALVSHLLYLIGIMCIVFDITQSVSTSALVLAALCSIQLAVVVAKNPRRMLWQNFASVVLAAQLSAIAMSFGSSKTLLFNVALFVFISYVIWWRQKRTDAYAIGTVAFMLIPVVYGQSLLGGDIALSTQIWIVFAALIVQWLVNFIPVCRTWGDDWPQVAEQLYALSAIIVALSGLLLSPWLTYVICVLIVLSAVSFAHDRLDKLFWSGFASAIIAIPLLQGTQVPGMFLSAALTALLCSIALSILYRSEFSRWWSTWLWFVMPVALSSIFGGWSTVAFAWAYFVVACCLVLSRAIARGVVFTSSKIPLTAYAKNASSSYVAGYAVAGAVSLLLSISATDAQLHATLVLAAITVVTWLLAWRIEKDPNLYALLPVFSQAILLSALRPDVRNNIELTVYLCVSTVLAVGCYFILLDPQKQSTKALRQGALISVFVNPFSVFIVGKTLWPMPIGLMVASVLSYVQARESSQQSKEWIGGLATISVMWFMYFLGVRNIQAYTHVLAGLFAVYAYIRTSRGEPNVADQYLVAMLATATIPLVLQALSGLNGGLYGWWLLLEMIGFMLLGMTINKGFVTKWGLYTALLAVLYQLRSLGYLALAVLAIFIIGIAIHKLLKYNNDEDNKN